MSKLSPSAEELFSVIERAVQMLKKECIGVYHRGHSFEKELVAMCVSRGLNARRVRRQCSVDLVINGKRVQCKHTDASCGAVRAYGGRKMSYDVNAFDVLAVSAKGSFFFVPTHAIPRSMGKLRNSIRLSSIRKWRDAWHVFDGAFQHKERTLFSAIEEDSDGTNS